MRIFELLNPPNQPPADPGMNDDEDQSGKFDANKVDQNLQDISQGVDDEQAQPVQPGMDQQTPPELDSQNPKPIDAALISQIKTLAYSKKYNFKDTDKMNPIKLAALPIEKLSNLLQNTRYKMQLISVKQQVGTDENKDMEFCNDLTQLINTIMHFKKSNTQSQLAASSPVSPWQSSGSS